MAPGEIYRHEAFYSDELTSEPRRKFFAFWRAWQAATSSLVCSPASLMVDQKARDASMAIPSLHSFSECRAGSWVRRRGWT